MNIECKKVVKLLSFLTFLFFLAVTAHSEINTEEAQNPRPLTFSAWKRLEIHNSQMDADRISKELAVQREKVTLNPEIEDQVILPEDKRLLELLKGDLKKATESLNYSKALTFKEYFDVHLKQFKGQPEALEDIASKMSKSSVRLLLQESLKATGSPQEPEPTAPQEPVEPKLQ